MTGGMIRRAENIECDHLTDLAFRSKAYWGYSSEFMQACREELAVTPDKMASQHFCLLRLCGRGFCGWLLCAGASF